MVNKVTTGMANKMNPDTFMYNWRLTLVVRSIMYPKICMMTFVTTMASRREKSAPPTRRYNAASRSPAVTAYSTYRRMTSKWRSSSTIVWR